MDILWLDRDIHEPKSDSYVRTILILENYTSLFISKLKLTPVKQLDGNTDVKCSALNFVQRMCSKILNWLKYNYIWHIKTSLGTVIMIFPLGKLSKSDLGYIWVWILCHNTLFQEQTENIIKVSLPGTWNDIE